MAMHPKTPRGMPSSYQISEARAIVLCACMRTADGVTCNGSPVSVTVADRPSLQAAEPAIMVQWPWDDPVTGEPVTTGFTLEEIMRGRLTGRRQEVLEIDCPAGNYMFRLQAPLRFSAF